MPNLFSDHTVVLAGYGFSADGPYLTINDLDEGTVGYVPVLGRTFSLRQLPRRRCIGRIDLRTHERSTCPLNAELLPTLAEEAGALGSAILGLAAATGEKDRTALAARFVRYGEASRPAAERHAYYQKQYQLYKDLREFEVRHVKG